MPPKALLSLMRLLSKGVEGRLINLALYIYMLLILGIFGLEENVTLLLCTIRDGKEEK